MKDLAQAHKDFLTGFYTREHLIPTLNKKIIDANQRKERLSILLIDIDHFKKINDKYGHLWGDEFLKYVSSTLRLTLENKGLIFRYGGDEFVVIFSVPHPEQALLLAKQFNAVIINRPFLFNGRLFRITISCGLATYPNDTQDVEELIGMADKALYFSKKYGRNTTIQASKIGIYKFKWISIVFLKVFFIIAVLSFIVSAIGFQRGFSLKKLSRLPIIRLLFTVPEADTTIILKSGDVLSGRIIEEDENRVLFSVIFDQGSYVVGVEKSLIREIRHAD